MQRFLERYLIVGYMPPIGLNARKHERFLFGRQELAVLGKRGDDGPAGYADSDSHATLDYEDPALHQRLRVEGFQNRLTISRPRTQRCHPS